jgi:GNAT superfamily N-acetyltransferase
MPPLSEQYHYPEKNIHVPEMDYLNKAGEIKDLGRLIIPSGFSIDGTNIEFDLMQYQTPRFLWMMLTAVDSQSGSAIGFRDVHINGGLMSWGEGCFGLKGEQLPRNMWSAIPDCKNGVPYQGLRLSQESDGGTHGFVVRKPFQGKGLGKSMLFTVFEIEQRLGVISHAINIYFDGTVREDESGNTQSYYQYLGARNHFDMYHVFDLNEKEAD